MKKAQFFHFAGIAMLRTANHDHQKVMKLLKEE